MLVLNSSLVRDYFACSLYLVNRTKSKTMTPIKPETKIIIVFPELEKPQPPKKPKINPWILKFLSVTIITVMSWLTPEAAITLFLIRLLLIVLQWLNQK